MSKLFYTICLMVNIFNVLILLSMEATTPLRCVVIAFSIGASILFILELKNKIEKGGKDV